MYELIECCHTSFFYPTCTHVSYRYHQEIIRPHRRAIKGHDSFCMSLTPVEVCRVGIIMVRKESCTCRKYCVDQNQIIGLQNNSMVCVFDFDLVE
jgi:hypothetical protein